MSSTRISSVLVVATVAVVVIALVAITATAVPVTEQKQQHKQCGRGPKGTLYGKIYQVGELAAQSRAERLKKINVISKVVSGQSGITSVIGTQLNVLVDFVSSIVGVDLEKDLGVALFSSSQKSTKRLEMLQATEKAAMFPSARVIVHSTCGCPVPVTTAITAFDGSFELANLPIGDYAVSVEGLEQFIFPAYRLEVSEEGGRDENDEEAVIIPAHVTTTLSVNDGIPQRLQGGRTTKDPVVLRHLGRAEYFVPRDEINPMSFLANPMVLMMGFSFVMMGMMKMVPKEEMKAQAKEMSQALEDGKKMMNSVTKK